MKKLLVFLCIGIIVSGTLLAAIPKEMEKFNKAQVLMEKKKYAEAIAQYRAYMKENPESLLNVVSELYIGDCYRDLGKNNAAEKNYKNVISTYKNKESKYWREVARDRLTELKNKM